MALEMYMCFVRQVPICEIGKFQAFGESASTHDLNFLNSLY